MTVTPAAEAAGGAALASRPTQQADRAARLWAVPALMVGMLSVQIGASFAKLLFPVLGPLGTVFLRIAIAALVLMVLARPWRAFPHGLPPRASCVAILFYGVTLGTMNAVFYGALERLPLGITVAIEFMGPLALAVLGSRRLLDLLWAALAVAGLLLLLQPWQMLAGHAHALDPWGVLMALGAGVAWALYILGGRRVGAAVPGSAGTALGMTVGTLLILPIGLAPAFPALRDPHLLAEAAGMALLSSALPYSIEMMALRRMSTRGFAVLMSLEPALAALMGLIMLGETLSAVRWAAIGAIVAASLGSALAGDAPEPAAPPPE